MAGRISALSSSAAGRASLGVSDVLTPGLVDVAVDKVLSGEDELLKAAVVHLWANDYTSEVAQMLSAAALAQSTRQKYSAAGKTPFVVRSALTKDEAKVFVETHPDYDVRFEYNSSADHGLGGTVRKAGSTRLIGNLPVGMKYADFGGNVIDHVENADRDCIVVGRVMDGHDPMREVLTRRRLASIVARHRNTGGSQSVKERVTSVMAASILNGEQKYHVPKLLQEFSLKVPAGIMVHVYDVPLRDIPLMMERCEMLVLEGTMHFSNRFFLEDEGEMPAVSGRFQVDRNKDVFRMGFVQSPVLWYEHKWSEFRKYGADQILHGSVQKYSYKIVSRRGDTIDFRVLPVGGAALPIEDQHYAMPNVPMVEVKGFRMDDRASAGRGKLVQDCRVFPQRTWEYMVRHAAVEAAKGTLDYNALVGIYMTLTAGDTYNGTSRSMGRVPMDDLPLFVVWSAVYALGEVMLLRRGVRTMVDIELDRRRMVEAPLLSLAFEAFLDVAGMTRAGSFSRVYTAMRKVTGAAHRPLFESILDVRPVARIVKIPGDVLETSVPFTGSKTFELPMRFVFSDHLSRQAAYDALMIDVANRVKEIGDREKNVKKDITVDGQAVRDDAESVTMVGSEVSGRAPPWLPVIPEWETYSFDPMAHTAEEMRAAVKEEIELCNSETDKLEAFFSTRFASVVRGREADIGMLKNNSAAWRDADLWWIESGVVVRSALGRDVEQFDVGGLYVPTPDRVAGVGGASVVTFLRPVVEVAWNGTAPDGKQVHRAHRKLGGPDYTGWAMSNRELGVFNGRQIVAGLQVALRYPFSFETAVYTGGPGCGKTTMIIGQHRPEDFIVSPLVKSVKDTRAKLVKTGAYTASAAMSRCRTNDSLLVAVGNEGKIPEGFPRADTVRSDEVFNGRYGRVVACFALLGAKRAIGFGDKRQIEPVVRSDMTPVYSAFRAKHVIMRNVVFRGAAPVVACINPHYDNVLRTMSVKPGTVEVLDSWEGLEPEGDYLLLCMNQVDKPVLRKRFPNAGDRIKTTHESQGGEADSVYLFCIATFKRPRDDKFHLYNLPTYVNVAISRARTKFVYVNYSPNEDLVVEWAARAGDAVAVSAARFSL